VSQFDAFQNYVAEAEKEGPERFPLYKWTKATIEDPTKRAKHIKTFALQSPAAKSIRRKQRTRSKPT
jgi:hypothetical protein